MGKLSPPPTELILNPCWAWQVASSGKGSRHQSPDQPPQRPCPRRWQWAGSLGLTCLGWRSHAAGACQSQAGSPTLGTHTVDVGGTPDYPGVNERGPDSSAGLLLHRIPQWAPPHYSSHCPTPSPVANSPRMAQVPEFQERVEGDIF